MKNIINKLNVFIESKKTRKIYNIISLTAALSAYFIAALNFQLIAHDHFSSVYLLIGTNMGFIGSCLIIASTIFYKIINKKFGSKKSIFIIFISIFGFIVSIIGVSTGTIGYLQFK